MKNKLRLISLIIGAIVAGVSALLIVIDGVAIIFTYASLLFIMASIGLKCRKIQTVYWLLFVLANLIFGWRAYTDNHEHTPSIQATPFNNKLFVSCSNKLFVGVTKQQAGLTKEQKKSFEACMQQER